MYYDYLLPEPYLMASSTPLPHIYPPDIDCVVRCDNPAKGTLYVSNIEGAESLLALESLKIGGILTCAKGYMLTYPKETIRHYKYLPIEENIFTSINPYLDEGADFIKGALSKTNVMVHCVAGSGRSVALAAAFLIKHQSMNNHQALSYLRKKRKFINLSSYYLMELEEYSRNIELLKNIKNRNSTKIRTVIYKTSQSVDGDDSHSKNNRFLSVSKKERQNSRSRRNNSLSSIPSERQESSFIHEDSSGKVIENKRRKMQTNEEIELRQTFPINIDDERSHVSQNSFNDKSIRHSKVNYFESVLNASHEEFIGVKRPLKNSNTSAAKQTKNMSSTLTGEQFPNKSAKIYDVQTANLDNVSNASSKSIGKNSFRAQSSEKSRIASERSEISRKRKQVCKVNPEELQDSLKMAVSCEDSRLSSSKKIYFMEANNKLNFQIDSIITDYEKAFDKLRSKYHTRLRNVKTIRSPVEFN